MTRLQDIVDPWWVECGEFPVQRGQLIHAFVPHVGLIPYILDAEGRCEPTQHDRALVRVRPFSVKGRRDRPQLPVAALPQYPGEVWTAYRAKVRPCLVVSIGGDDIPRELRPQSSPRWQTEPTIVVAPYYGTARTADRSGWPEAFLTRMRNCQYRQFLLDILPTASGAESVLRLDHLQPVGKHHDSYSPTKYRLSDEALELVDEWLEWLVSGDLGTDGLLAYFRPQIAAGSSNTAVT